MSISQITVVRGSKMSRITIAQLLLVFAMVVTCGIITSITLQTFALAQLKVGGPVYKSIIDGKDLVADVLPPPLYLVEAYMLATEAALDPDQVQQARRKIQKLQMDYQSRREYWRNSALPGTLKRKLTHDVLEKGDAFWQAYDGPFLHALKGQSPRDINFAVKDLGKTFWAHDVAVRELVTMANDHLAEEEAQAAMTSAGLQQIALAGGAGSVLLFLSGILYFRRRAITPLKDVSAYMTHLAGGDLTKEVPFSDRSDEIGKISHSVEVFLQAALERQRFRIEAEEMRSNLLEEQERRASEMSNQAEALSHVVRTLGAGLSRLAECDIQCTIDDPFAADFEPLRFDFNNALAALQAMLVQFFETTQAIYDNGNEMRSASDNLAKRTEQQAAALEETSAAFEQLSITVAQTSARSLETRNLVAEAKVCTEESGRVVLNAISAMKTIEQSAAEIGNIIVLIDEIALQTNLLALNAGVEAARAGKAGKGFAVVAQEVRELAQRSAEAAKEIKSLVSKSGQQVALGVKLVDATGDALSQISGYVTSINENVNAIATCAIEQSAGLKQISIAINELDRVTQQNAAMAEETAALSETLYAVSTNLHAFVGRFVLDLRQNNPEPDGSRLVHLRKKTNRR